MTIMFLRFIGSRWNAPSASFLSSRWRVLFYAPQAKVRNVCGPRATIKSLHASCVIEVAAGVLWWERPKGVSGTFISCRRAGSGGSLNVRGQALRLDPLQVRPIVVNPRVRPGIAAGVIRTEDADHKECDRHAL